ncbi:MAG: DUF4129 domain-containing protein [Firmicutes bacterium]|nr:DUF4129 domain-containing protein [Bacillota bacterium]
MTKEVARVLPAEFSNCKSLEHAKLAQLAVRQHWMDRFILPLLAVVFTLSILLLARQYLAVLAPAVYIPGWLVAAWGLLALESVYAAGFHLRLRTPISLRILEFALMLLPVYWGLWAGGIGQSYSFLSSKSFGDPQLLVPLGLAVFAWGFARGYGIVFAGLGDIARDVGDQGAATFSWETESYFSDYRIGRERSRAVDYFTRRLLFYAFLICLFDALVIEAFPDRLTAMPNWRGATGFVVVLMLFSGLVLQACVYLYRLHSIWREVGISVQGDLSKQWLWASLAFVSLVIALALILPWGVSPFDFTAAMGMMTRWLEGGFKMPVPQQGIEQPAFVPPVRKPPMEAGSGSWLAAALYLALMLLLTLLVLGVALAIIGLVIIGFLQEEWERLPALLRLPVYIYLWVKETAAQLMAVLAAGAAEGKKLVGRLRQAGSRLTSAVHKEEKDSRKGSSPSTPALYIRHLFVLMVEDAKQGGLSPKVDHTPLEYAEDLAKHLGKGQEDLEEFTEYYLKARYSREELSTDVCSAADVLWQRVMAAIDAWRGGAEEEQESVEKGEDVLG